MGSLPRFVPAVLLGGRLLAVASMAVATAFVVGCGSGAPGTTGTMDTTGSATTVGSSGSGGRGTASSAGTDGASSGSGSTGTSVGSGGSTAGTTGTGGGVPAPAFGLHVAETVDLQTYVQQLDVAVALGAKVVRVPVDWAGLEPVQGSFDPAYVAELQGRFQAAEERGIATVLLFAQSPGWANGGNPPPHPPLPEHRADYADALVELLALLPKGSLEAVEVWNEPNSVEFWGEIPPRAGTYVLVPLDRAAEYAALLAVAYDAVKQAEPDLLVLGGSLASADTAYLEAMVDAGAVMDGLSVHPYARVDETPGDHYGLAQYPDQCNRDDPLAPPWCFEVGLLDVRTTLDDLAMDQVPIWITEFGADSGYDWGAAGGEDEQDVHLNKAFGLLRDGLADQLQIPVACWYRLQDEGNDLMGLVREDGTWKPAAGTFQTFAQ